MIDRVDGELIKDHKQSLEQDGKFQKLELKAERIAQELINE